MEEMLGYELSAVPSSIFDEYGDLRKSKKVDLRKKLAIILDEEDAKAVLKNFRKFHVIKFLFSLYFLGP